MENLGILVCGFVAVCAVTCAGLILGWGHIIQAGRDLRAGMIRSRRRARAEAKAARNRPKLVKVPPIVANRPRTGQAASVATGPVRVVSVRTNDPSKRKPLDAVPRRAAVTMPTPPPRPVQVPPDFPSRSEGEGQYTAAGAVLSRGELAFFQALREAVGGRYHISHKIRLADLVNVRQGEGFYRAFNQVAMKHIDFILLDHATMRPALLVELDDKTHREHKRRQRDKLVNRVCKEAGLRIVHIKTRASYDVAMVRRNLEECIVGR